MGLLIPWVVLTARGGQTGPKDYHPQAMPLDDPYAGLPVPPPPRPRHGGSLGHRYREPADEHYRSPVGITLSEDGSTLYVSCEDRDRIFALDPSTGELRATIPTGRFPFSMVHRGASGRLYVTNRRGDSVSVIDTRTGETLSTIRVGDDPHGLVVDPAESWMVVANLATDDLSVVDLATGREVKRLMAGRFPFQAAASPDLGRIFVSSQVTLPVPHRTPPEIELTMVDTGSMTVVDRKVLRGAVIGQGVAVSPDGRFVVVALEIPKNLLPETQIYQGWMVTYAVAVAETMPGGKVAYLLLDEPNLYFADPYGVAFSRDGRYLYVTSSGVDTLTVIDWAAALKRLRVRGGHIGLTDREIEHLSRDLAASGGYVVARVHTGRNPKQVVVSPDDRLIYVANRLSDSVSVISRDDWRVVREIDLGGPRELTRLRRGAIAFHFATISFQHQLSCNTCHPENLVDGLVYDIAADGGMGLNLTDNRTLRGIALTPPFKWSGKNPNLARQEGPRAAQLFFRSHGFTPREVDAITAFIESFPLEENRYRGSELNEFQRRGMLIFERDHTNDGRYIPVANRCVTCHPAPHYTDLMMHDVGTRAAHDDHGEFDTPGLNNIYEQAPFLHDGRCWSLEEIWTVHNPFDTHGVTNDMTKEQLNDLIEYLKTL